MFDPAKAVSADISQGSDVNKHQGSINFNDLVDPTHTVCADLNPFPPKSDTYRFYSV